MGKGDGTIIENINEQEKVPTANTSADEAHGIGYKIFQIIQKVLVYLLAAAMVIGGILFASSKSPSKSIFGYRYYIVLTPSMQPTYEVGDMVFVKLENAENINVGDVITFNPSNSGEAYLTHRVVEKLTDYEGTGITCFRTRGDANDTEDSFLIDESRVIGTVKFNVPKLGYFVRFVQLRWYILLPLVILAFVSLKLIKTYFLIREKH